MKNFIKQNLVLFIFACTSVFIFLGMLYLIVEVVSERGEANEHLDEFKAKIEQLNAYKPYPSGKNIEMIKRDINAVNAKTFQLENVFGNIYAKPLSAFMQQLKQNSTQLAAENNTDFEASFFKTWKTYIENKKKEKEQISLNELLNGFIGSQKYEAKIFQSAKSAFMAEMQKQTLEPLSADIIDDYILNALGIPLYFSRVKGKTMVSTVQDDINKLLESNNVTITGNQLLFFSEITTIPSDEQIPYMINYCRFLEDFYKRLANAKIESIESYNKINGIKGTEDNNFLTFRYQINVIASQESLRNFLNSLQEAYKDDRIYVVKSLALSAVDDNSTSLPPYVPPKTQNQLQQIKILLGTSDMVKASITVDYIMFKKKILN